jgi:hypothetical protein
MDSKRLEGMIISAALHTLPLAGGGAVGLTLPVCVETIDKNESYIVSVPAYRLILQKYESWTKK